MADRPAGALPSHRSDVIPKDVIEGVVLKEDGPLKVTVDIQLHRTNIWYESERYAMRNTNQLVIGAVGVCRAIDRTSFNRITAEYIGYPEIISTL